MVQLMKIQVIQMKIQWMKRKIVVVVDDKHEWKVTLDQS
jgi:hypothetical protein